MKLTSRLAILTCIFLMSAATVLAQPRLFSKFGRAQVDGRDVLVHVTVAVPPGIDGNDAALNALRGQGARPFDSEPFTTTGLLWDQFFDSNSGNDSVLQNYNPSNDPTGGGGLTALLNTHAAWNAVPTSSFQFLAGDMGIGRCPSLVKECPGRQTFDGNNDVAWVPLSGAFTLAVTWSGTSIDEADIGMNTNFSWFTNGNNFDVETVMLHENGHGLGLGHSQIQQAVMYASYQALRRALHQDDVDGVSFLYPVSSDPDTCTPSPEVCGDGIDNDCDDLVDEFDPDCCGNGIIGGVEDCDGANLNDQTCFGLDLGFEGGTLACNNNCSWDTSGCTTPACPLLPVGASCTSDGQCCSNKCRGKSGAKSCR